MRKGALAVTGETRDLIGTAINTAKEMMTAGENGALKGETSGTEVMRKIATEGIVDKYGS